MLQNRFVCVVRVPWRLGLPGDVKKVDAEEGDDKAHEKRDGSDAVGGVESLEEDEGGDKDRGGEADVVHRVDTDNLYQP